ncbi:MAG: 50S ribosomal protein L24 [Clostridiales bacterium]|nr:50S ribosomal protein L24 [Clostridiales bacterium]MDO4349254.1 50S ribosomal protein L24 [Eubacteriales bacterium]MDY4008635.1 50S ribosomal protein L24 [Candidatus Limiplasma sp.]
MITKVHVKTNDQVVVISGPKDGDKAIKGKQGKILSVDPKAGKVVVEGVAFVTKHLKPRRQGQQGGIIQKERAIDASNVMLVCPKCGKATRVAHRIEEVQREDGSKKRKSIRVCKRCKADID